jgi:signal transduction histidine kinase/FixJ family two-component response regulator
MGAAPSAFARQLLQNASVRTKLRLLTTTAVSAALLAVCAAFVANDVATTRGAMNRQLTALATVLGANATAALEFDDPDTAQELLRSLSRQPSVELACLFDRGGTLFATYARRQAAGLDVSHISNTAVVHIPRGRIQVIREVVEQGEAVGSILLRADMKESHDRLAHELLIMVVVLLLALAASIFLADRLQYILTARIQQLVETMVRVTADDDYSVRVGDLGHDELGALGRGFDVMVERVQQAMSALKETHDQLEERVRQRTEELEEALRAAQAANQTKNQFLANMSHEIRTPMTAIIGYSELLLDENITPETRRLHVGIIQRNGSHLLSIINDILDISKIEAGRLRLDPVPTAPDTVVAEVVSLMKIRAAEKQLDLRVEYRGLIPERIETDPARLRQILVNLVGNAIKFTDTGSVRVIVEMCTSPGVAPALIRFSIADTGSGIAPQQMCHLFQPFSQADDSMARRYGGTGLGLAISRRLAIMLGGEITFSSEFGKGSRFSVTIATGPLHGVSMVAPRVDQAEHASLPETAPPSPAKAIRGRVLLAEDGMDNQRLISWVLQIAGATVVLAENGEQAIQKYHESLATGQPFHCILMDMQMPVLDGYEAVSRLREANCRVPIVALTAHAMQGDREKCLAAGCDDYATKPIDRHELARLVARYCNTPVNGNAGCPNPASNATCAGGLPPVDSPATEAPIRSSY